MGANEFAAVFEELFESVCFQRFVVVEVVYTRLQWRKSRGVSFIHHGDFRVAAVPESLSLLHSYLCM